jgi:peptide/nickel transport system permease protein
MSTMQMSGTLAVKRRIRIWEKSASLNAGVVLVALVFLCALVPGLITSYSPTAQDADALLMQPSMAHLFGTDNFGRDLFARVVYGTRIDLTIGILAMAVPFVTGSLIGLVAGYYGGWVDSLLMRILDVFMAFPFIVLVIAIVAILGPGLNNLYIAIWLVGWKDYARLVRSEVMVAKSAEYVQAAKVLGFRDVRILLRHILPNVLSVSIVFAAADVVMCMLSGASLSFLGLGVQPPAPEWGALISEGRAYLSQAWWICAFPGVALVVAGTGFSLLGDGLSDLLRTKGR